jgi:hypothetical protein
MPSSGVRGTETDDPTGVYAAQEVLINYADEVRVAAGVPDDDSTTPPGWCEVAIDAEHDGVLVYWKGAPPAAVTAVLSRATSNGVTPRVMQTTYDRRSLQPTVDALVKAMDGKGGITLLSIENDCSAVRVGLKKLDPVEEKRVKALVPDPSVPLRFEKAGPVVY